MFLRAPFLRTPVILTYNTNQPHAGNTKPEIKSGIDYYKISTTVRMYTKYILRTRYVHVRNYTILLLFCYY